MRRSFFALLAGCTAAPPPPPPPPTVAVPDPAPIAEPEAAPVIEAPAPAPPPAPVYVSLSAYLDERQVPEQQRGALKYIYDACEVLEIGKEEALWCAAEHIAERQGGMVVRMRLRQTVYLVRDRKVTVALDVIHTVTQLDKEVMDQQDVVNIELVPNADRTAIELRDWPADSPREKKPRNCDEAAKDIKTFLDGATASDYLALDLALIEEACAARGVYRFDGTRFVRVSAKVGP